MVEHPAVKRCAFFHTVRQAYISGSSSYGPLCANCHREDHANLLQLPQVTVAEKLGEFREPYTGFVAGTATLSEA